MVIGQRNETPDRPPREPVEIPDRNPSSRPNPKPLDDPSVLPDPKPIDNPRPRKPRTTMLLPVDAEIERLLSLI
jgi:hypothetical protein